MKKLLLITLAFLLAALPVAAQNFSMDARRIGMGGVGEKKNGAADFAGDARQYRSIVVPLGLFQILKNLKLFNPGDDEFNPIRAMEYLASPLHFTVNRDNGSSGEALVNALVNANLNRNLNTYRGWAPESHLTSSGLMSSTAGVTIRGFYFGAGPYVSIGTDVNIDERLITLLESSTDVYSPNTNFLMQNTTDGQAAAAITGGWRGRVPVPGQVSAVSERDGLYLSGNYNYLYGIHYDTVDLDVRFDTDAQGLVTLQPTTTPLVLTRTSSKKGNGFALDLGSNLIVGPWDVRFSANGIANRINWEDLAAERITLNSILSGASFVETSLPSPGAKRKITLPVQYVSGVGYNSDRWAAAGELSHGIEDTEFRGGVEYRLALLEFRGGSRFSRDRWHPTGGVGLNVTQGFGIDFAVFSTATNIERDRKATIALSLRLGGGN